MKKLNITIGLLSVLIFQNLAFSQSTEKEIIRTHISKKYGTSRFTSSDFNIIDSRDDKNLKGQLVNINQTINGIPIYGAISSVLIKNDKVSYFSDNFLVTESASSSLSKKPSIAIESSLFSILSEMGLPSDATKYTFTGRNPNTVKSELVYFPKVDKTLVLAYVLNFFEDGTNNYWNVIVDANTGQLIDKTNLTLSCSFGESPEIHSQHSSINETNTNETKSSANFKFLKKANKLADQASYRVFAVPIESPSFGSRTLETNPWYADASPLGWHNDGDTAYTFTRGNNTYTYADETGANTSSGVADGGTNGNFDFTFDDSLDPSTYKDASITNLFYMTNKMHDIFYRFGFDEAGRNFQASNFGKGDEYTDLDPVLAEARDGGGFNNANFATPADGFAPRMQMYLWKIGNNLNYNSPADLVPRKPASGLNDGFGSILSTTTPITKDVVLASPLDACTALSNTDLTGKIALIQRGTCTFEAKFKNAQDKGAVAVIVYNANATQAIGYMSGTNTTTITIPGILVDYDEGSIMKSKIDAGTTVNVSLQQKTRLLDGSLDNGIVAHEYTHGISNRSTGNGYSCLNYAYDNEQMGEGWSDFFSLMVTNKADGTAERARGIGTYVYNQNNEGRGIRPAKYSPDFTINNYTYGNTNGMYYTSGGTDYYDVHSIGFIWASMLWDLHWKFAEKYGFSNDIANNPNSGSAKIVQLVFNAFKLQGCYPTFVKGRDAIIAADAAINNGANKCTIWQTFAKRGLGVNASPGTIRGTVSTSISDQVEDFSVPAECDALSTQDINDIHKSVVLYPNPAKNALYINSKSITEGSRVKIEIFDLSGKKVYDDFASAKSAIDISKLSKGVYVVKGEGIGVSFNQKLIVEK